MKNARIWLYVIAGIQTAMGFYEYATTADQTVAIVALCIDAFVGLSFLVLALWSRKKPYLAFVCALSFYALFNIAFMVLDASNLYRGVILKLIIVIALVKAIKDAKKYEEVKAAMLY